MSFFSEHPVSILTWFRSEGGQGGEPHVGVGGGEPGDEGGEDGVDLVPGLLPQGGVPQQEQPHRLLLQQLPAVARVEQLGHDPSDAVVLPSLGQGFGEKQQDFFHQVEHTFQFFSLCFVSSFLTEIGFCCHKGVIDNEVDVRVVGIKELDDVSCV